MTLSLVLSVPADVVELLTVNKRVPNGSRRYTARRRRSHIHKQPRHVGVQGVFAPLVISSFSVFKELLISNSPRHVGVQGVFAPWR